MRILILGKTGQVGWELCRTLMCQGEVVALGRSDVDLSDRDALRSKLKDIQPDVIVNAAAYTQVDKAEEEKEMSLSINADAPGVMAEYAAENGSLLIHYSTDYVFNGEGSKPYLEDDELDPVNAYGSGKLAGEEKIRQSKASHIILRTSWVYAARGHNFLKTMLRLANDREELKVVDDQVGCPTWSRFIAQATSDVIANQRSKSEVRETFHLVSEGVTSWCGFAREIIRLASQCDAFDLKCDRPEQVKAIASSEFPTPARRPAYSAMDTRKIRQSCGLSIPTWKEQLSFCLAELSQQGN